MPATAAPATSEGESGIKTGAAAGVGGAFLVMGVFGVMFLKRKRRQTSRNADLAAARTELEAANAAADVEGAPALPPQHVQLTSLQSIQSAYETH